jgi:hypothetical protein
VPGAVVVVVSLGVAEVEAAAGVDVAALATMYMLSGSPLTAIPLVLSSR